MLATGAAVQAQTPEADALRVRAEAGNAEAQHDLGVRYFFGEGVPKDDAEAVRLYRLAAEEGVADAVATTIAVSAALYGHSRMRLPYDLTVIGY